MLTLYLSGLLASVLHFNFFMLESVLWGAPWVNRIFKLRPEVATSDAVRTFAFNMGFYNLFLSLGSLGGLYWLSLGRPGSGLLVAFCCASMVLAGLVLVLGSGWKRLPAGLIQAGPPAVCLYQLICCRLLM